MIYALWVIAVCKVVEASLAARAKGFRPIKRLRARNEPEKRVMRVGERA